MSLKDRFKRAKVLQIIINRIHKGLHNCKPLLPIYFRIIFIHYLSKQANCICCTNNNFKSRKMYPIKIQMYTIKVINEKSEKYQNLCVFDRKTSVLFGKSKNKAFSYKCTVEHIKIAV